MFVHEDMNAEASIDASAVLETTDIADLTIEEASEAFGFGGEVEPEVTVASLMLAAASDNPEDREWAKKELESLFRIKKKKDKYGLNWSSEGLTNRLGKERSLEALETNLPYFTRRADLDVEGAEPNMERPHILIEGDNLHALTVLRGTHTGKVDLIYIDPPYNTGKEFTYNDNFIDPEHPYRHSAWLDFMWRRLKVARELLAETGVVMISIDDNEQANLKLLCDEVFGEGNFIANVVWSASQRGGARFVNVKHDYILIYARNYTALAESDSPWMTQKDGAEAAISKSNALLKKYGSATTQAKREWKQWLSAQNFAAAVSAYSELDDLGPWQSVDISPVKGNESNRYVLLHPGTGLACKTPKEGWRFKEETMAEKVAAGRIHFGVDETSVPRLKEYLSEKMEMSPLGVFQSEHSDKVALERMIGAGAFDFPKTCSVLKRWFSIAAPKDAVILDFFAGSGSTGHAVAALNAEDGGTRQCIMVTLDENGICQDVTRKRMEAVLTGVWADGKAHEALPGSLVFYQANGMAELPEFTGSTVDREMDLEAVAASCLCESVFLAESAWLPLHSISDDLAVAMKADGDVVAVWGDTLMSFGILDALKAVEAPEGGSRTIYVAHDVVNNAGGLSAFTALGWTVRPYPAGLATGLNRARKQATADHE